MGHAQHHHREGHKGQQRHIVGDQHGAEKAQQHQHQPQETDRPGLGAEPVGQHGKNPGVAQPGHHHHQAVQQRQGAKINIAPVGPVRRHKEAADQRRQKGDAEGQLLFYKVFYPAHSTIAFPFRAAETSRSP